ncbi:metal ABC transporter substrate-binding protein [Suipraeoptans intestinalis]|uniref:metal ABC transporter substrate-binding protein n=1 Tax=Suipraeoptans intestinalis TaxID=2606628 RepID=UPI0023F3CC24|nr:metal ABC transporter substrate-binding protein [Suipraeoptans intestinalis]MDD7770795.1 metal ABC transporter substrate-binding protein [Suipraeoptans intestinalis]MDY3122193.1 metal ABC transporter substrate-binding protein [Suipraeoptans intestinalis]
MKRGKALGILVLAASVILCGCGKAKGESKDTSGKEKKIKVVTSFYPMYDFATKVAGDKAEVVNLVPAGTEPHDWEPTTSDLKELEEADVFVYNGAGMEEWAEDVLESLENKKLVVVEASKGVELLKGEAHHHEEEGEHSEEEEDSTESETGEAEEEHYDPHVWLNPLYAGMEMEQIKEGLIRADSANKSSYEENCSKYKEKLEQLDQTYKEALTNVSRRDLVTAHEAFGYLCQAYGLNQVGIEGLSPDSEPDLERMHEIVTFAKENHVTTIFFEELVSPKVAKTIAEELGAKTAVLNPVEGLTQEQMDAGEDYFSIMKTNLEELKKALQ